LADVLATCVDAGGGEPSDYADTDGQSLVDLATSRLERPRRWLEVTNGFPDPIYHSLTDGRWKYIYYFADGVEQLFDLESDPREVEDLSGDPAHRSTAADMRRELIERLEQRGSPMVRDGDLIVAPLPPESEAERRARSEPGYCTSDFPGDIKH